MQNIHVKRYHESTGYQGFIEPEDRSWVVFIHENGIPSLWRRTAIETSDGKVEHVYVDSETPGVE